MILHAWEVNGGVTIWEAPIVKELRQHRLAIEAEAGHDWGIILARAVEAQQSFAALLIPESVGAASPPVAESPDAIAGKGATMAFSEKPRTEFKAGSN